MERIVCPGCRTPVGSGYYGTGDFFPCSSCRTSLKIDVFPAFVRPIASGTPGDALIGDEASCFYHLGKKAEVACGYCGRYLCALCDIELGGKHLCPACLEGGKKKGKLIDLERHRVLYDSVALKLAILPLIIFWITLVTAPAALYLSIRHWSAPTSVVTRGKGRFVAAIILSGLEILGWALGIAYFTWFRY
jgi:hypothetical protein